MASTPETLPELVGGLFWPDHPVGQAAVLLLLGFALVVAATVYVPLLLRLFQIGQLQRAVQTCFDEESSNTVQRQEVGNAFSESPLAYQWTDFVRRWQNAIAADPIQNASLPELSRAPVRLLDVLEEHPVIPAGARRSLLPALPAIFLSAGLLGAFSGLVLALPGIGLTLDPGSAEATSRSAQIGALLDHLGMALRIGLWGLLLSLGAGITGRLIEGRAELLAETLDGWVQLAYGAISTGELATRTAHEQRSQLASLQEDLTELLRQVSGRPRPMIRSTAPVTRSGSVDASALEVGLQSLQARLSEQLSERLDRSVSEQLAALRDSLEDRAGGAGGLGAVADRLARSSEAQSAASGTLTDTARTVSDAAEELRAGLDGLAGVVATMRETGEALDRTAERLDGTQASSGRSGERLGEALERLEREAAARAHGLDQQLAGLRASLDTLLGRIDERAQSTPSARTGEPAAPTAAGSREPARTSPPDRRPEPPRPGETTPSPAAAPEPPAPSGDADTLPYLQAPQAPRPEMIYAGRGDAPSPDPERPRPRVRTEAPPSGSGTLSGLLRPTHHADPPELPRDPDDFDPHRTVALEPHEDASATRASHASQEEDGGDTDEGDGARPARRGGFFGRRK